MDLLLIIGITISVVWIVIASFNRVSVLLSAPIAAIIVVLASKGNLVENILGKSDSYVYYLSSFVLDFFFIFVLGSIMAKYLQKSGAIKTISTSAVKLIDIDNPLHGMVMVYMITSLLTYGGVSLFVVMFAAIPLAKSLFSQMNIPWKLAPLPIVLGLGTFTAGSMPGSPSVINVIPTKVLGTTLMASPVMGLVSSAVTVIASIIYMWFVVKKEVIHTDGIVHVEVEDDTDGKGPNLILSLAPIFLLLFILIVGSELKIDNILTISLLIVILFEMFTFRRYITSQIDVINSGTIDSLVPLLSTASTIAYGSLIANIHQISEVIKSVISASSHKLITASIITIIFSLITASASGAIGIVMSTQGAYLLSEGLNADVVHRLLAIASTIVPNTPHSGVIITLLTLSKLTRKEDYKHVFIAPLIVGTIAFSVALLFA